jgi:PAS domain S-box-containing protein
MSNTGVVLVSDGDRALSTRLAEVLRSCGCSVLETAGSVKDIQNLSSEIKPGVVLFDCAMLDESHPALQSEILRELGIPVLCAMPPATVAQEVATKDQVTMATILDSIPTSVLVVDRMLRVLLANRNFLVQMRRSAPDTVGHQIQVVLPAALVEVMQLETKIRRVSRTGEASEADRVTYRAPGVPNRVYYYRLVPLGEPPVQRIILLIDDITERARLEEGVRQAERHLANLVQCADDAVVALDPEGHIITWNRAAERFSGLLQREVRGCSLLSLTTDEHWPVMAETLKRLAQGRSVRNVEMNLQTVFGSEVSIAWNCSPLRDPDGTVVGIVAVGRDLTDRRQMEARLIQTAKAAALGVMAGGIAHELRNPLSIISASAQLMTAYPEDGDLRSEALYRIHAATQRSALIVENLVRFASPRDVELRTLDITQVLDTTLEMLMHQASLSHIEVAKSLMDHAVVYGSASLLQSVFTNVILNAIGAMPDGGTLLLASREFDEEQIEVTITDTGVGIPADRIPSLFDPFYTTKPVGEGTGLGLALSYRIIERHRGTIEIRSEPRVGTEVVIHLRRRNEDA